MSRMLTALADLFQEDLAPGIAIKYAEVDPIFQDVVTSSETVVQDELTKGYKAIHTFATSLAGAIRYGSPLGPQMNTNVSQSEIISAHETYPGVSDSPLPGLANRYITVARMFGSIPMNLAMIRGQKLDTTVGNYPALVLEQAAYNMAHCAAINWYLNDSAQAGKLDIGGAGGVIARSGHTITLTADTDAVVLGTILSAGRIRRILPGIQYDVWKGDATMSACYTTRGWSMVDAQVDHYGATSLVLYFQYEQDAIDLYVAQGNDGGTTFDLFLVPYSAVADRTTAGSGLSIAPCGYQSWVRETGTLFGSSFGDLNVANYGAMFKSKLEGSVGSVTEHVLNKHIAKFEEATGVKLDTILTTNGVLVDMLETYGPDATTALVTLNREQGSAASPELGWTQLAYRYNGRLFKLRVSDIMDSGSLAALKTSGGNLVRYEPAKLDGTDAMPGEDFDPRLEWLGPRLGYPSIWMPAIAPTGAATNGVIAPFEQLLQHATRDPRSLLLTGCNEFGD